MIAKDLLSYFGALAASYLALKIVYRIWNILRVYVFSGVFRANVKKYGDWAVVTGATDGIGKGYANELARRGMDIVLISRSKEKLETVATEIEKSYRVQTKILQIDFSQGLEIYDEIKSALDDLDIGVLVNNVGVSNRHPQYLLEMSEQLTRNLVNVNLWSVIKMTQIVLPGMVFRKRGAIINISSASGTIIPVPFLSLYSSIKAAVAYLSSATQQEYKDKGVTVQCVSPFFVATKMVSAKKTSVFMPSPTSYARSALNTLGLTSHSYGCLSHYLQKCIFQDILPECLISPLALNGMKAGRKRAIAILEKRR